MAALGVWLGRLSIPLVTLGVSWVVEHAIDLGSMFGLGSSPEASRSRAGLALILGGLLAWWLSNER